MAASLRVGIVHNPYQVRGGEDVYVDLLTETYTRLGWTVERFPKNAENPGIFGAVLALNPFQDLEREDYDVQGERPDFLHVNHLFPAQGLRPLLWAEKYQVPVLMTVHNHRFYCSNGVAFRDGQICTLCHDNKAPWRALFKNCNQDPIKSTYYTLALGSLNQSKLLHSAVTRLIAPSPYISEHLLSLGFKESQIRQMPHPVNVVNPGFQESAKYDVIYAGRLSVEKGVEALLAAIERTPTLRFVIAGHGPLESKVRESAARCNNLTFLPGLSRDELMATIAQSRIGTMASGCNESFGFFAVECFMLGKRCVVSHLNSARWLTENGFPGVAAANASVDGLVSAFHQALELGEISSTVSQKLSSYFGMDHFLENLSRLALEVVQEGKDK